VKRGTCSRARPGGPDGGEGAGRGGYLAGEGGGRGAGERGGNAIAYVQLIGGGFSIREGLKRGKNDYKGAKRKGRGGGGEAISDVGKIKNTLFSQRVRLLSGKTSKGRDGPLGGRELNKGGEGKRVAGGGGKKK